MQSCQVRVFDILSNHRSVKLWLLGGFFTVLALAGCTPAPTTSDPGSGAQKVADFQGGEVRLSEVEQLVNVQSQQFGGMGAEPGSPQFQAMAQQAMPSLLALNLAEAYAQENGITVSGHEVDEELAAVKTQVGEQARAYGEDLSDEEAFQQAIDQAGYTIGEVRDQLRDAVLVRKVQEEVAGDVQPTEQEVEDFYNENRDAQFTTSEQRCIRHILFNPDQEDLANEVRGRIQNGEDFAEQAREHSEDPGSAEQGGELGCNAEGQFLPEFEEAAFSAEEGEIVGPVRTQAGFHLIQVTEIQPEETIPLAEVSAQIEEQLSLERQAAEFDAWVQDQLEQRNVRYLPGYDPNAPQQPEAPAEGAAPQGNPSEEPAPEEAPQESTTQGQ